MSKSGSRKNKGKKTGHAFPGELCPSKSTIFLLGFLLLLVGAFGVLYNPANSENGSLNELWTVSEKGVLSFSVRDEPVFSAIVIKDVYSAGGSDTLKLLTFESQDTEMGALLRLPETSESSNFKVSTTSTTSRGVPGLVLLPGAGVSKEGEQRLAMELSSLGYASLALDQRNYAAVNPENDLGLYKAGLEPLEYKMVYDALKAADVLAAQPEVDPEKIAILGESNGGRFAIIASALEPSLKGAVGISTCGYGTSGLDPKNAGGPETYRFYRSIDPDTYLAALPPAKLVMLHSFNDTVIEHELALRTFKEAEEPKTMYNVSEATHGYTASMKPYIEKELAILFS